MIEIYFDTNGQASGLGYEVSYREIGTISYSIYPTNFYSSPAILELPNSTVGYEGFINPQCSFGSTDGGVPWTTNS